MSTCYQTAFRVSLHVWITYPGVQNGKHLKLYNLCISFSRNHQKQFDQECSSTPLSWKICVFPISARWRILLSPSATATAGGAMYQKVLGLIKWPAIDLTKTIRCIKTLLPWRKNLPPLPVTIHAWSPQMTKWNLVLEKPNMCISNPAHTTKWSPSLIVLLNYFPQKSVLIWQEIVVLSLSDILSKHTYAMVYNTTE